METNFNFKSSVCTDKIQSERLLALGLKKETADCFLMLVGDLGGPDLYTIRFGAPYDGWTEGVIPAWSLGRLIEMCDVVIRISKKRILLSSGECFCAEETLYGNLINCIEWLIKEGYFNKEYLV